MFGSFESFGGAEQFDVKALEQVQISALARRHQHDDSAALVEWKLAVIQVIPVERYQRPPKLPGKTIVLTITRTPQVIVLDNEQDVPVERLAHVPHEPSRNVRVHVDARLELRA